MPLDIPNPSHQSPPIMTQTLLIVGIRGLGREIALHFARLGWRVLCSARTDASTASMAKEVTDAGGDGVPLPLDLLRPESLVPLHDQAIDLCIAAQTAGGRFGARPLLEIDDAELDRSYHAMMRGTWNLLKAVGPGFTARRNGTFLQMGTSSGVRTKAGFSVLGATQHGLRALVQVAAREWRTSHVHAAYVAIDGPINSASMHARSGPENARLDPQEIARACEYLHSQQPAAWTHELVLRPSDGDWTSPT